MQNYDKNNYENYYDTYDKNYDENFDENNDKNILILIMRMMMRIMIKIPHMGDKHLLTRPLRIVSPPPRNFQAFVFIPPRRQRRRNVDTPSKLNRCHNCLDYSVFDK